MSKETVCTGCGATVTQDSELYWRDSGGYKSCSPATGSSGLHRIEEDIPPVAIKPEVSEPTPGSVWVLEKETVRFIKIATEGRNCTSIAIKKSDGSVLGVELQSWIGEDSKPMVQA